MPHIFLSFDLSESFLLFSAHSYMSGKKIVGFLRMIIPLLHFLTLTIEDLRKQKPRSISFHFGHMLMSIQSCDLESGSCPAGRAENLIPETRWKQVNRCNLVSAFIGYFLCCVCSQSCDETERTLDPRPLGNHLIVAISSLIVATVIISIMLCCPAQKSSRFSFQSSIQKYSCLAP